MQIQVLSDLHIEFHADNGQSFLDALDPTGVDVLVVAGDAGLATHSVQFLKGLCQKYPHVVFVVGNHEYYNTYRHIVVEKLNAVRLRCPNFHPLLDNTVTIDGQRFVGSTLWFPDSPKVQRHKSGLNDFHCIRGDFERWVVRANEQAQAFLRSTVTQDDVVVTHHIPTPQGSDPRWRMSSMNIFFITDMEELIQKAQPKLWVYGHTHDSHDFKIGETRLVCNPFGYAAREENPNFDWGLKIDLR